MSRAETIANGDDVIGIYMHGAYCAEQERGIQDIESEFNVGHTTRRIGCLPALLVEHPNRFFFARGQEYGLLCFGVHNRNLWDTLCRTNPTGRRRYEESYVPDDEWQAPGGTNGIVLRTYRSRTRSGSELIREAQLAIPDRDSTVTAAWSNRDFAVAAYGETVKRLEELYRSFQTGDTAIWLGGGTSNPFGRPGLAVAIYSKIPEHVVAMWETYYSNNVTNAQ